MMSWTEFTFGILVNTNFWVSDRIFCSVFFVLLSEVENGNFWIRAEVITRFHQDVHRVASIDLGFDRLPSGSHQQGISVADLELRAAKTSKWN